jgi:hypothetical protein
MSWVDPHRRGSSEEERERERTADPHARTDAREPVGRGKDVIDAQIGSFTTHSRARTIIYIRMNRQSDKTKKKPTVGLVSSLLTILYYPLLNEQ